MRSQINEEAFESTVEAMLLKVGWNQGDLSEWDTERALFPERITSFLRKSDPSRWETLEAQQGDQLETQLVNKLVKELNLKGTLHVLRHGFKFFGKTLRMAHFKPAHGLNAEVEALFALNELTVTRQARCHPEKGDTIDLLFALNGLPVATCELKNPLTNQSWRHAVNQYKNDRSPNAPLFRFKKRALVHFAADPYEVHMTTRLAGSNTRFLPFNRGNRPGEIQCGAGNPSHPSGYPTGYFWEEVLEREKFLNILGSYMFIAEREEKTKLGNGTQSVKRETVVFPRFHQLDAVSKLVDAARADKAGHNYLIQHSAGSGKTISISLLAHRLATLHTAEDKKIFDCVLVITDRRVLDRQLQDAIYQIEHVQGVVKAIDRDAKQLARALVDGTKIVITTLQKFPFVLKGLLSIAGATSTDAPAEEQQTQSSDWQRQIAGRRYAIIVDEAHSSQSGETAREMKELLGEGAQRSLDDSAEGQGNLLTWEDNLNAAVEARGPQPNLSFFAFTATPKNKTIELFGTKGPSELPEAFHVYSMRQAIEERFILDVLSNYTDYSTYYRLAKRAADDPNFPERQAAKKLCKFVTLHPHNVAQKTEIIVEHFRTHVRRCIEGRAKAMVVTSGRLHAVRYMQAFEKYITEKGYEDVRPLVAFSGTVRDPKTGEEFTEPAMNFDEISGRTISEAELPSRFDSPEYQILLVAEKYQTGFDQPLLQAMYVDKRLDGVQAVQTLSRLNRIAPKKAKPFVLDFVNDPEDIGAAFAPYYDKTALESTSDPDQPEKLKHELDEMQVYHQSEIWQFCKVYFAANSQRKAPIHKQISKILLPAKNRFEELDEEEQDTFHSLLSKFLRSYSFISQILPYADRELEALSAYGRALLPMLWRNTSETIYIEDLVDLESYRLKLDSSGKIELDVDNATLEGIGAETSNAHEEEITPLSEIIDSINERFGTELNDSDRLFLEQIQRDAVIDEEISKTALANPREKFNIGVREQLEHLLLNRMSVNRIFVDRCLNEPDFRNFVFPKLSDYIYDALTTSTQLPLHQ